MWLQERKRKEQEEEEEKERLSKEVSEPDQSNLAPNTSVKCCNFSISIVPHVTIT